MNPSAPTPQEAEAAFYAGIEKIGTMENLEVVDIDQVIDPISDIHQITQCEPILEGSYEFKITGETFDALKRFFNQVLEEVFKPAIEFIATSAEVTIRTFVSEAELYTPGMRKYLRSRHKALERSQRNQTIMKRRKHGRAYRTRRRA